MRSHKITKFQKSKHDKSFIKIHNPMKRYDIIENMQTMRNMKNMKDMENIKNINNMENMNQTMQNNLKYAKILEYDNWCIEDISRIERDMLKNVKRKEKYQKPKQEIIEKKPKRQKKLDNIFNIESYANLHEIFIDEEKAIKYLFEKDYLKMKTICHHCNNELGIYYKSKLYRCKKQGCRKSFSIFKDTVFAKQKLPINEILHILYEYLKETPRKSIYSSLVKAPKTITRYSNLFRDIFQKQNKKVIFGDYSEIDESMMSRRKYNKGRLNNGQTWVIGITNRKLPNNKTKDYHIEIVDKRDRKTCEDFIKRNVKPGSIIYTDSFKSYHNLKNIGYEHKMVNHSKNYVDKSNASIHTQNVENMWGLIKRKIKPQYRGKKHLIKHFNEFKWRNKNKSKDIFEEFLNNTGN